MKHAQHTPGPWGIKPMIDEDEVGVFTGPKAPYDWGDAGSRYVCIVTKSRGGMPETLANARLIAAAPDLLAALQGARAALRRALPHCPPDDAGLFVGEWLDEIKAAIAKACPNSED